MSVAVEVFPPQRYARETAARIALSFPGEGSVVLTGGTTAQRIYEFLADADLGWGAIDVYFSDERRVPPDDPASNYGMVRRTLLDAVGAPRVHRMAGELEAHEAAEAYDAEVADAVRAGFDVLLVGMGADCHIAALFPGSRALEESERLCVAVERPDGRGGLTLTPPALTASRQVLLVVSGEAKAEAVRRAIRGEEAPARCPARLLSDHPDATFLLDEDAAALL